MGTLKEDYGAIEMRLMRDNQIVMRLSIILGAMTLIVLDAEIVDESGLPPGIRIPMRAGLVSNPAEAARYWLRNRQLPDYREGLDEMMIQAYKLEACQMGRLYKTQHTAAVLSYFVSGFDRYYMTPIKMENICYALEDFHFPTLYMFPPCSKETADTIRQCKIKSGPGMFEVSPNFTIPSGFPSWWESAGTELHLAQKPNQMTMRMYREVIRPRFQTEERDGIVHIYGLHLQGDFIWMSELIPYLRQNKGGIWEQVEDMLSDIPGSLHALRVLQECEAAANQCGRIIAWSEMGIACNEQAAEPMVIL